MNSLMWELENLELHIDKIEEQLDRIAASQPAVALLRTMPGIGPRSAEAIVAFADQETAWATSPREPRPSRIPYPDCLDPPGSWTRLAETLTGCSSSIRMLRTI